ncbi:MAG: hypothetical protein ACYC77_11565 [Coriobacteriia bacterium]
MGFFVVGRSSDGSLAMLGSEEYESREAAARGIQTLAGAGSIDVSGRDVYIVDMAGAAPVVIVGMASAPEIAPAAAAVPEVPAAGAWEAPSEPQGAAVEPVTEVAAADDETAPEGAPGVVDEVAALEEAAAALDEQATPGLADVLKRAATSLEDEGIVAPESIGSPVETVADDDLSDVIASLAAQNDSGAPAETEALPEEATDWPWANVAVVDQSADEPTPDATGADATEPGSEALLAPEPEVTDAQAEVAPIDLGTEQSLIVSSAAFGEDAFEPRPLIMGDYDSIPAAPVAEEAPPVHPAAAVEVEVEAGVEDLAVDSLPQVTTPAGGYESSGELELDSYSCDDCVYSNTCPKVGESAPDECGSFQWKAT